MERDKSAPLGDRQANSGEARDSARRSVTLGGWIGLSIGTVLWGYGYFATGTPRLFDWAAFLPHWFAETLPNAEAELGMALILLGCIPVYWEQWRSFRNPT